MAEVLVDALNAALGVAGDFGPDAPKGARAIEIATNRVASPDLARVFRIFGRPARVAVCDCERPGKPALPQTLFLMTDAALLEKIKSGRLKDLARFGPVRRGGGRGAVPRHPVAASGRRRGPVGPRPPAHAARPSVGICRRALGTDQYARICAQSLNHEGPAAMSRTRTDCEGFHRRDFLTAGAAGLLGLSLPDMLRAEAAGDTAERAEAGDRGDPDLALGRAGDDRHVGPEARRARGDPRRVPPDRHGRAGRVDHRAHAEAGEGDGPLRAGPLARPHDHGARAGHDLHGHGQPAEPRPGLPVAGFAGGAGLAAAAGRPAVRDLRRAP